MPKILVVNKTSEIRGMIKAILEASGFQVSTSKDAKEAMEAFYHESFDLVITDLNMSSAMNGEELLWVIKESESDTEAIVLTSNPSIDSAVECLRNDLACDYLAHPIDSLKGFVATIHKALKKRAKKIKIRQRKKRLYSISLKLKEMNQKLKDTQLEVIENEKKNVYDATVLTAAHSINQPLTVLLLKAEMIEEKLEYTGGDKDMLANIDSIKKNALKIYDIMDQFKSLSRPVFKDYLEGVKMIDLGEARADKVTIEQASSPATPAATRVPESPPAATRVPESPPAATREPESPLAATREPESPLAATRVPESPFAATRVPESPFAQASPATPAFNSEPPELVEPKTILIVEDEAGIKDLISEILNNHGYNTISASNGEDGLKSFKKHQNKINLIITDIRMPKINGIELYHQIVNISPGLPIICLTGYDIEHEAQRLFNEGKIQLLIKPFPLKELVSLVKEQLEENKELLKVSSD